MGPLATKQQFDDVRAGIARLAEKTESIHGDNGELASPVGGSAGVGFFVAPVLRRAKDSADDVIHAHEVFGPVATVCPYSGDAADAANLVALGSGGFGCEPLLR